MTENCDNAHSVIVAAVAFGLVGHGNWSGCGSAQARNGEGSFRGEATRDDMVGSEAGNS